MDEALSEYIRLRNQGYTVAQAKAMSVDGYTQLTNGRWHNEENLFVSDPQKKYDPKPVLPKPNVKYGENTEVDVELIIDMDSYPEATKHMNDAIKDGHPDILTIDRPNASIRREQSLKGHEIVSGKDRDEYLPAMFMEGGTGASVRPIDPHDNRGLGSSIKNSLANYDDGSIVKITLK